MRSTSLLHRRAALALAASTLLCAGLAHAADPVKIGYLIPLSGSAAASIGKDMSRATHLAIKHINEGGGIKALGGAPLELVEVDSRGDAKVAITEVGRLITREKTPVLLGAFQSGVTFPATASGAESPRHARFSRMGHTPGLVATPPATIEISGSREFPFTLDLRR